ncbi:MAG: hypothetical protein ABSG33_00595 [Candidatus Bathyarchaeia archaeon]
MNGFIPEKWAKSLYSKLENTGALCLIWAPNQETNPKLPLQTIRLPYRGT